jgi:hypothetical protein
MAGFDLFGRLKLNTADHMKGLREAEAANSTFSHKTEKDLKKTLGKLTGSPMLAKGLFITAAVVGVKHFTESVIENASETIKMAQANKVSIDEVQRLRMTADETGQSLEELVSTYGKLKGGAIDISEVTLKMRESFAGMGKENPLISDTELDRIKEAEHLFGGVWEKVKSIAQIGIAGYLRALKGESDIGEHMASEKKDRDEINKKNLEDSKKQIEKNTLKHESEKKAKADEPFQKSLTDFMAEQEKYQYSLLTPLEKEAQLRKEIAEDLSKAAEFEAAMGGKAGMDSLEARRDALRKMGELSALEKSDRARGPLDSLAKIGGFTGTADRAIQTISERTMRAAEETARNTREFAPAP